MLIDISRIEIIRLSDSILEKAGFKHGYYTNLVPKKIRGKDGVERIHWVNPDPGKKVKLTRVAHHREGEEKDHYKDIKQNHVIEDKDLVRFSAGDKVVVTWGQEKGQEGVFRGSLAGPSPRASIAFLNSKTGKYEAKTMNINHIKLVHRADAATNKVIERKTVEATNIKGKTILVDREDFEKYYKDRDKRKTMQERVAEEATRLSIGGAYSRPDGRIIRVKAGQKVGGEMSYTVLVIDPSKKKQGETVVAESHLQDILGRQKYERIPLAAAMKNAKVFDDTTKSWKTYVSTKPLSADLESGDLHKKGHFPYGPGGFRVVSKEDETLARQILAEHWPTLTRVVAARCSKYSAVSEGDITPADIIDGLVKAVASYEPLMDKGGGIEGRLMQYADSYARSEAEKIQEREMSTVRDDFIGDGTAPDSSTVADKAVAKDALGGVDDIMASAFVSKHDAIALEEGLADEADLMSWLYEDPQILEIMKQWTGLGVFESTFSKKEAAEALTGLAFNPKTMEPYATSTIETVLLPKELERIKDAFRAEGKAYPEFMHVLKEDVNLRNKLTRNRKLAPVHPQDEKVIKVVRDDIKKPDHRAAFAAQLAKYGVPLNLLPAVMQTADRILAGSVVPDEYPRVLPREAWEVGSKALTQWFKEHMPPSVFTGKRGIALGFPRRFDVETPIKAAIANEGKVSADRRATAEWNLERMRMEAAKADKKR